MKSFKKSVQKQPLPWLLCCLIFSSSLLFVFFCTRLSTSLPGIFSWWKNALGLSFLRRIFRIFEERRSARTYRRLLSWDKCRWRWNSASTCCSGKTHHHVTKLNNNNIIIRELRYFYPQLIFVCWFVCGCETHFLREEEGKQGRESTNDSIWITGLGGTFLCTSSFK